MKTSLKKTIACFTVAAVAAMGGAALVACNDDAGEYTVSKHYTDANKSEIPSDAVNQVMFAYSDNVDVTFSTKFDLDAAEKNYTLYKCIEAMGSVDGENSETVFKGEYEFYGTYVVDGNDPNKVTLKVPDSGKVNVYYPTVLNYQSVEKQTQDWVNSSERPDMLTRFNKWYPAKNAGTVDQPVTLDGNTMTFGEVTITAPTDPDDGNGDNNDNEQGGDEDDGLKVDENALTGVVTSNKVLNFYSDGTFKIEFSMYGADLGDTGTWTFAASQTDGVKLTLAVTGGDEIVATMDGENKITVEWTSTKNNIIVDSFVLTYTNWSKLMSVAQA